MLTLSESSRILEMMRDNVTLPRVLPYEDEYLNNEAIEELKDSWPMDIIGDKSKWPRMVYSKVDFIYEVLNSSHLDECWVIPDGIRKLGLDGSIPYDITQRLNMNDNAYDLVKSFTPDMMDKYNARFCYTGTGGNKIQKEAHGQSIHDKMKYLKDGFEDNTINKDTVYMTELRYKDAYPHPISGEIVKTVSSIDVKDIAESIRPKPADRMYMYWDRYDEGLFIGGKNSGKCLHVDQCLWSNIGKNYTGWKLLALWSVNDSNNVLDKLGRQTFEPPLTIDVISILKKACRIVIVRPGDVCLFSGGIAHTVISISKEVSMTVYESFVSMNTRNIEHWLDSANPLIQHPSFTMPDSDLDSIEDDVLDNLDRLDFVLDREEREAVAASTQEEGGGTRIPYQIARPPSPLQPGEDEHIRDIEVYNDYEGHHYHHYGLAMDTACRHIANAVECVTRKRKYFRKELRKTKRLCAFVKEGK